MMVSPASSNRPDTALVASALRWLADCGLDTVVDAAPRNWLASAPMAPAVVPASPVADRGLPARPAAAASKAIIAETGPNIAVEALMSLDQLDAALVAMDHPLGRRSAAPPRLLVPMANAPLLLLTERPVLADGDERRLLAAMFAAIGIKIETISHAALVPWSTPGNRAATADEIRAFQPFLMRALALAPQRCILALGQTAGQLAAPGAPLRAMRDRVMALAETPMIVSCAPLMLLRQPALKADAWADLQRLAAQLAKGAA